MEKLKFFIVFFLISLLSSMTFANGKELPPPDPSGRVAANNFAPPPNGLPIDDHLMLVLISGLLFGSYMIYRYNQKQKNPV